MTFEFEEQKFSSRSVYSSNQPKMIRWLIDKGIVKSEKAASTILIGIAIVFFVVSAFFFFKAIGGGQAPAPTDFPEGEMAI